MGIVAAKIGDKIVAPMEYDGTMDSFLFETWFEHHFLPVIKKGTVIVMDNASFHRKKQLIYAAPVPFFLCRCKGFPPFPCTGIQPYKGEKNEKR